MMNHSPHQNNTSGTSFRQRLGYFMVGTAIGLVALGFIMSSRQRAVQQQAADRAQVEQAAKELTSDAAESAAPENAKSQQAAPESDTDRP